MRVTFVMPDVKFTTRSGGYRVHYEMAGHLAGRGHQVTVVHKTRSRRVWLRFRLWNFFQRRRGSPFIPWFDLSPEVRLVVTMRISGRTAPPSDVFLFTDWRSTLDAPHVISRAPCAVLVWDYEFWVEGDDDLRTSMQAAFAQPGLALVAGSVAVRSMLESMGATPVATIPPGIDHDVFHDRAGGHRSPRTVGFLNRPGERRGIPDLLVALEPLAAAGTEVVAGGATDAGLPPWVAFTATPHDTELADLYCGIGVFVLPSHVEGLGLPALEAMACGAAVVVTDNGGSRQFARDRQNARVVPSREPEALRAAVRELLRDDDLRADLAHRGGETARSFTWERAADELEALLEALR
jgi:glycosyltransferase involved in cell wall biosynthesis